MAHPRPDPLGPGQESVWDYPRPPSAEVTGRRVVVELGGRVVAATGRAVRVCGPSHPPVYYVPSEAVAAGVLQRDDISGASDFFALGGTSMAAMQIVFQLAERLAVHITLTDFFDAPDLDAVAELITERREAS